MKAYGDCKPTQIESIGVIPKHWKIQQIKHVLLAGKDGIKIGPFGSALKLEFIKSSGFKIYGQENVIRDDFSAGYKYIDDEKFQELANYQIVSGDIIVTMMGTTGKAKVVPDNIEDGIMDSHLTRIRVDKNIFVPRLLELLINNSYSIASQIKFQSKGAIMDGLNSGIIKSLFIPVPPLEEQNQIAQYLDHKTSQIDKLITDKEKLIELLNEERTAIINQAVTKGLNPDVPMKDSGIEWLGKIPKHWELKPLKYVIKDLQSGVSVNSVDQPVIENEYGILKTSCVYDFSFRPEQNKQVLLDEYNRVACPVTKNCIIISRMNTPELVGASGYVDQDYPNLFLPDRLWKTVFHGNVDINVKWLSQLLISNLYRELISSRATGSSPSMKNISKADLLTLIIPFPSVTEQDEIQEFIDRKNEDHNTLLVKLQQEIQLLKEYKTALISEVVTGKVDVRDEVIAESTELVS